MANKYTEELFGAVDTILTKRLEQLEKDTTILCRIVDASNANNGEYIVTNTSLNFSAYSENKTYEEDQNVWVLIPNGDYGQTKIIIGKYVSSDTESYTWENPLNKFIDMSKNVLKANTEPFGLIANSDTTELDIMVNGDNNLLKEDNQNLAEYSKIAIIADFWGNLASGTTDAPVKGNYGLEISISALTKEDTPVIFKFYFDSLDMSGAIYTAQDYITQSKIINIDKSSYDKITGISIKFYQRANFYRTGDIVYPVNNIANIFVKNIQVLFGYSTDELSGTTAFLRSANSLRYNGTNNIKTLRSRLAYYDNIKKGYISVNSRENLLALGARLYGDDYQGQYPKVYWYRYDLNSVHYNSRFEDNAVGYEKMSDITDAKDLEYTIELRNSYNEEYFRSAFIFKNETAYSAKVKRNLDDLGIPYTEEDEIIVQLLDLFSPSFTSDDKAVISADIYPQDTMPSSKGIIWDFAEKLITESPIDVITSLPNIYAAGLIGTVQEGESSVRTWQEILKEIEMTKGGDSDFDDTKRRLEITIPCEKLVQFINENQDNSIDIDLIRNIGLQAIDTKKGIYNIYKASQNANCDLIRAADAFEKRPVEVSFFSILTQISDDQTTRIYWAIPKTNTMIKPPVEGVSFGVDNYSQISLTMSNFYYDLSESARASLYTLKEDISSENDLYDRCSASTNYNPNIKYFIKANKTLIANPVEEITIENGYSENEVDFIRNFRDYYIIEENRTIDENIDNIDIKKASVAYQIKSTFRKSLTNNRIYAGVYKNNKFYQGYIDLQFGVKGINGTDYTLSIEAEEEGIYDGSNTPKIISDVTAWTRQDGFNSRNFNSYNIDDTTYIKLRANLYDIEDNLVSNPGYTWSYSIPSQNEAMFTLTPAADGTVTISLKSGTFNGYMYKGLIVKCVVTYNGNNFEGYYILPVRTKRIYNYIEGPDEIIYDSSGVNPDYYNTSYKLYQINEVALSNVEAEITWNTSDATLQSNSAYFPNIINSISLVPKAMFVHDVEYKYLVKLSDNGVACWYQPILTIIDRFGNNSLNEWNDNLVITNKTSPMSTIMGSGKKEDNQFTGLLIGDIYTNTSTSSDKKTVSGIAGYYKDDQIFGLYDNGNAFFGKQTQSRMTIDSGVIKVQVPKNNNYINLIEFSGLSTNANKKYFIQSYDYSSTNKTGLYIDLLNGKIASYGQSELGNFVFNGNNLTNQNGTIIINTLSTSKIRIGNTTYNINATYNALVGGYILTLTT